MFSKKTLNRIFSIILSLTIVLNVMSILIFVKAEDYTEIISGTVVNGDMNEGSWYKWAGDSIVYEYEKDGEKIQLTGNMLDAVCTSWNAHGGEGDKVMCFGGWGPSDLFPVISGDTFKQELAPGCKSFIDEEKFKSLDLSSMTLSVWVFNLPNDNSQGPLHTFDVKYRTINFDGSYGNVHTVSLTNQLQGSSSWINATAYLDDMTDECANAKTIELEISAVSSYSALFIDDIDVSAPVKADVLSNTLVNGDMEDGSWYKWAGDQVLGSNLTGNQLNSEVSSATPHSGNKGMQFIRDWGSYPATGDWGISESVRGCKTTIDEAVFQSMDLSNMTFSIWAYINGKCVLGANDNQFFTFDITYRAVNYDDTYGNTHTVSLIEQFNDNNNTHKWVKATKKLDDMTNECLNAKTIEFEVYVRSYCSLYLDDADVTAPQVVKISPLDTPNMVTNGDAEEGIWPTDPSAVRFPEDITVARDTNVKFSGNASARLESRNVNGNASMHAVLDKYNNFDNTKRYRISMDVKTEFQESGTGTYFGLLECMPDGAKWNTVQGTEAHNSITQTQDWRHFTLDVSSFDPNTTHVVIYIHMYGVGKAWYDNIKVQEIPHKSAEYGEVVADVESGAVVAGSEVWLTTGSEDADIYYTIDGSDPITSSTRYFYTEKPVIVTENITLKAVAIDNKGAGEVSNYNYTVKGMLLSNDGFENGVWQNIVNLDYSLDKSIYYSGKQSLKINGSNKEGSIESNWAALDNRYDYELSFKVKTENLSSSDGVSITMKVVDIWGNEGLYESRQQVVSLPLNSDWTEYKVYMNDLCYKKAKVYISTKEHSGSVWFDDIKLIAKQEDRRTITVNPIGWEKFAAIYYDKTEKINIKAQISSISNCDQNLKIEYHIVDLQNGKRFNGGTANNFYVPQNSKNLTFNVNGIENLDLSCVDKYGIYRVVFTVTDSTGAEYEAGYFDVTRSRAEQQSNTEWLGISPHIGGDTYENDRERLELLAKAGIGNVRCGTEWASVEKSKGVYTFDARYDELMRLISSLDMDILFLLGECNNLYNNGEVPTSDEDVEAFAAFCAAAAKHYRQFGIKYFEIWNEFDYDAWLAGKPYSGAAEYTKIVKKAYTAIKAAVPDAVIITGCTSGVNYWFIEEMMKQGAYDYTDAISVHPYSYQESEQQVQGRTAETGAYIERCRQVYDMVNSYGNGPEKKIWITEFGFPTAQNYDGQTEQESAMNIIRSLALTIANSDFIEKAFIYEEVDRLGINVRNTEHYFGLNHGLASNIPYSAKPALPAMSAFATMTENASYKTTHHYGDRFIYHGTSYGNVIAHEYKYNNGKLLYALYDLHNKGKKVSIKLNSTDISVYDFNGNQIKPDINEATKTATLNIDGKMVYIVLNSGNTVKDILLSEIDAFNSLDLVKLRKRILLLENIANYNYDINNDGFVDVRDLIRLKNALSNSAA